MYSSEGSSPQSSSPSPQRRVRQNLSRPRPYVTFTLMGFTIVIFLLQTASQFLLGADYPAALGMKINPYIVSGELWRLFTPMFLHGSVLHLGFNMYALFILGPGLEDSYGHERFIGLYLISGFAGNVFSFLFSISASLGSSTAVFGLIGAQGVLLYRNRGVFGAHAQRALMSVVMIAAINLFIGLSPGIDNWGHVGGLVGGALFAWFAGPLYNVQVNSFAPVLTDDHDNGDAIRTGLVIFGSFALLAAVKIYLNF